MQKQFDFEIKFLILIGEGVFVFAFNATSPCTYFLLDYLIWFILHHWKHLPFFIGC